jgi:hypothetical protein
MTILFNRLLKLFGNKSNLEAEVTAGLSDDAVVILHPSDRLKEGMRVIPRDRDEA